MSETTDPRALVEDIAKRYGPGLQKVQFPDATELVEVATRQDRVLVSVPRFIGARGYAKLYSQRITVQLGQQGKEFMLPGVIEKAIRIKPGSETGRRLGLEKPSIYYLVRPTGRPRAANVRDKRYAPPSFIPIINQARRGPIGRDCNLAVRAYLERRVQQERDSIPTLPTDGVEVHVWPLKPGEITQFDPQLPDITGVGPRIIPLAEALQDPSLTAQDGHEHLFGQLSLRNASRLKMGHQAHLEAPPLEVQALGARQGRRTVVRGMAETQFVNVGPLEVMHIEQEAQPQLTVRGKPRISRSDLPDPCVLNTASHLYVFSLFTEMQNERTGQSFRFIVPYRWHSANEDLTRLKPCDLPLAYTDPPVSWLDINSKGLRLVHGIGDVETLLGQEIDHRMLDAVPLGVTTVGASSGDMLEQSIGRLLNTLIGVDLFIDAQTMDFALTYGTATDAEGNTVVVTSKDGNNDHFPYELPPYISMIGRISNIQIVKERDGSDADYAVVTGVEFVYRHLCGDILGTPIRERDTLLWHRLGKNSKRPLESLLNKSELFMIERVKQVDRKQQVLETFRLQQSLAEARVRSELPFDRQGATRSTARGAASSAAGSASRPTRSATDLVRPRGAGRRPAVSGNGQPEASAAGTGTEAGPPARASREDTARKDAAQEEARVRTANEYGWTTLLIRGANPFAKLPRLRRLTPEERRRRDGK